MPADDCVTCFQAIDFYIANKAFLFELLSAVLQNAEEGQWQHVCGRCLTLFFCVLWCITAVTEVWFGFFLSFLW